VYVPDWEPLANALKRVMDGGPAEQQARVDICNAVADRKIGVRVLLAASARDGAGQRFSGGNLRVPERLVPDDFDWDQSRPLKPWPTGPTDPEQIVALWSWMPRPIELLELSTGDVIDVLCNLRPPAAPASIEYREPTGSEPPGRLNRGGRPAKFQWDDIWFRIMRYLHEKGFPEHQAEMVVAIQELCRDADLGEPDESTLKPKVRRLFKIWHEAEKGHN
jgi:hypothetical protein